MGFFLRVWYSLAIAISVVASTWGSTRNINFWTRVGIVAAAFFAAFSTAYAFQGKDIEEAFKKQSIAASVSSEIEVKVANEDNKGKEIISARNAPKQQCCTANSFASITTQFGVGAISVGTDVINRYFLLDTIWGLFGITSASAFWWVFGTTYLVKFIFSITNEGFATSEIIARYFNETRPFYARFFRPLAWAPIRKSIRFVGAGDHTFTDDLLPWLGYLPKEAVTFLAENRNAMIAVASIGSVVGGLLAILIYQQTYFYEGKKTEENLLKISNQLKEMPEKDLPAFIGEKLMKTINLMAPLHGVAGTMPVYFIAAAVAKELLGNSPTKWAVDFGSSLLIFLGILFGVYFSEVRIGKGEIAKRIQRISEKQPLIQDSGKPHGVNINSGIEGMEDHSMKSYN